MPPWIWIVVVVVAIAVIGAALIAQRRRAGRVRLRLRPLPAEAIEGYRARADDLERLFVTQPRQATVAAKLLVDDILVRIGYPVRLTDRERIDDLRRHDARNAERYAGGTEIKADANSEQMRRALASHLGMARDLMDSPRDTGA
ncbi:MAG: hypothetical protein ACREPA_00645 [Candidatus Dormibacteraceae bacterium]